MPYRIVGIGSGAVDTVAHEINFELTVAGRPPMAFAAEYGPAAQFIGALGRLFFELRQTLLAAKGMKSSAGEQIASSHIQRDRWENVVLMQLTTPQGVPYTFAMQPQIASEIAEQLKTESAKPHQTGHA
jgi:hypothetical protein